VIFIEIHRNRFGVEPMCRVLTEHGVRIAPSTFYAARSRPPSSRAIHDAQVMVEIRRIHSDRSLGRGVYGVRKMWKELKRQAARGVPSVVALGQVPRCQVQRLMRTAGLRGVRRGKTVFTTRADPGAVRAPDLVSRDFTATRPNQLWVVDFTYVSTWTGIAYTAFVSDVYSRRIVGWRTASSMPTELPLDALEMALWIRDRNGELIDGLVHHSDAGSQYTSIRYTLRLADAGAVASIGTVGDSYDNAMAESVIGLYKTECTKRDGPFRTVDELELATSSWVHWFNTARLHSKIGYVPPVEHEAEYYRDNDPRQQQPAGQPSLH
jgi:putative transposase